MNSEPYHSDLVLLGGGHSHLAVIKKFAMNPVEGLRITVISRDIHTPYSGMLPGLLAGHYQHDDSHIDLRSLCEKANVRFFHCSVTAIDPDRQQLHCDNRGLVRYDWLSINIGSQPALSSIAGAADVGIVVKPVPALLDYWQSMTETITQHSSDAPFKIIVVGGGAASVEIALASQLQLQQRGLGDKITLQILCASAQLLASHNQRVQKKMQAILTRRGIDTHTGTKVLAAATTEQQYQLQLDNGNTITSDAVVWAIHAASPSWLSASGLQCNQAGFVEVNQYLQSCSHSNVFAAGDIAHFSPRPLPKSGVYAVRAGKILAQNLRRAIEGRRLKVFVPQHSFLSLLMTGDKYAVASRGPISFSGRWVWWLKNAIDRKFVSQYSDWNPMSAKSPVQNGPRAADIEAMRCGGCGAKVGSQILSRVMAQLHPIGNADVIIGLNDPDDAAVIIPPANQQWLQTVDYFRAFIDDPYLLGRIATNHCLSDIYAMGATPHTALAIATVPYGSEALVEDTLLQLMRGAVDSLNEQDTALIGGHSSEGAELGFGLSVNGTCEPNKLLRKGGLRAGLSLILSKPLGTGALFAANMAGRAQGRWVEEALEQMLISNRQTASILHSFQAVACTDITGFGLLGHLAEMIDTDPGELEVRLQFSALPLLAGAAHCIEHKLLSSLHIENSRSESALINPEAFANHLLYPILFDPQTAGGLLAAVPTEQAQQCLLQLQQQDCPQAAIIGSIDAVEDGGTARAGRVRLL